MPENANKLLVLRYFDAINSGNYDRLDEIIADDYLQHYLGVPPGREMAKRLLKAFRAAFPDVRFFVDQEIVEGDKVVARSTTHGTHRGEYLGHPPTNRSFRVTGIDIFRVAQGQLVEHWAEFDTLGMLTQLALVSRSEQEGSD